MKKAIGSNVNKAAAFFFCLLLCISIVSCQKAYDYRQDITAVKRYLKYRVDPNNLKINKLSKYAVSDQEIYYYVEWEYKQADDNIIREIIVVFNPITTLIRVVYFSDMEYGFSADVKLKWEGIKDSPSRTFTEEEISMILQNALSEFNKENDNTE